MDYTIFQSRADAKERYQQYMVRAEVMERLQRWTGRGRALLRYDDVANRLGIRQQIRLGLQSVSLDKIVGSVGRHREFSATFLPLQTVEAERWANVDLQMNGMEGLPPVELYKVGAGYFVLDGNHRVSVARVNDCTEVEAYVTDCVTAVPVTVDDFWSGRWRAKAAVAEFVAHTGLDRLRPDHGISFSSEEHAQTLEDHISVHRYFRGRRWAHTNPGAVLTWEEAAASWYDSVYLPIIEAIHAGKAHDRFPQLTETELYLGVTHHRESIAAKYQLAPLSPAGAVATFVAAPRPGLTPRAAYLMQAGARWSLGRPPLPFGMEEAEFDAYRTRHQAGELTVTEARHHRVLHFLEQGSIG